MCWRFSLIKALRCAVGFSAYDVLSVHMCDETPGRFADYDVGDIVATNLFTRGGDEWGYDEPVRVIAREWHPDNTCILEVAEWA